jgi:hypothetical protein
VYEGKGVIVCVSLCCPFFTYAQINVSKSGNHFGWDFFKPENAGLIEDQNLSFLEKEIIRLITKHNISLFDRDFLCKKLPTEIAEELKYESHNEGNQFLHGIFQKTD